MFRRCLKSALSTKSLTSVRGFKKTIDQLAREKPTLLKDAKVLVRVDFNVPQSKTDGSITDDTRIREALPTIKFLIDAGAKVLLTSHCGRPDGKVNEKMRMAPMAKRLSELLNKPVPALNDCVGAVVDDAVAKMKSGDVVMLENTRFHKEEEENVKVFAQELAKNATVFVNDAFGTAHRAHASTEGVCHFVDHKVGGFLMKKELDFLKNAVDAPKRPFAAIVGGAKVSTKITVIESLIAKCDKIFLGGGMIFTFYRAQGLSVGKSMVEENQIEVAKALLAKAAAKGVKFYLPTDVVVAPAMTKDAVATVVSANNMPADQLGLDIGPDSLASFTKELKDCKTVVWNGPMGVFEIEQFAKGTFGIAHALADVTAAGGITIVGGGDSVAAVHAAKLSDKMSHISTGGGASLEMLEGKDLPGVSSLDNA